MNQPLFVMPQNCAVTSIWDDYKRESTNFFVTGGVNPITNQLLTLVLGVEFMNDMDRLNPVVDDFKIQLDIGRALHESCKVMTPKGLRLLLLGGRVGATISKAQHTNSVIGLDLQYILRPSLRNRVKTDKWFREKHDPNFNDDIRWQDMAPMICARSNFGVVVIQNKAYAFGGISGKGNGDDDFVPKMPEVFCESYDPIANTW
jgi:hypothetical protein